MWIHPCNICNADLFFSSPFLAFDLLIPFPGFNMAIDTIELLILLSFFIGIAVGWWLKKLLCPAPSLLKNSKSLGKRGKTGKTIAPDADFTMPSMPEMPEEIYICRTGHKYHPSRECVKNANPVVYSLCLRCKNSKIRNRPFSREEFEDFED